LAAVWAWYSAWFANVLGYTLAAAFVVGLAVGFGCLLRDGWRKVTGESARPEPLQRREPTPPTLPARTALDALRERGPLHKQ
jgi:hypothetical protein